MKFYCHYYKEAHYMYSLNFNTSNLFVLLALVHIRTRKSMIRARLQHHFQNALPLRTAADVNAMLTTTQMHVTNSAFGAMRCDLSPFKMKGIKSHRTESHVQFIVWIGDYTAYIYSFFLVALFSSHAETLPGMHGHVATSNTVLQSGRGDGSSHFVLRTHYLHVSTQTS